MIRVKKVILDHKLYTGLASSFCSACRLRDYGRCYINSMYPALVPKLKAGVVHETMVMYTGVAPVIGFTKK